jgi:hypothetical protein
MISVFRGPHRDTGKLLPVVFIALGGEDIILTNDTATPTPAIGLDPETAREVARRLVAFADEIDGEE